ncbi:MAG: T9SS type A sorting domain-containing protein [Candidatus Latescibacteria bacterium]|nr:T9SS type A sorting domain-containing protein [Candidatus Latescibacterota bacterium]
MKRFVLLFFMLISISFAQTGAKYLIITHDNFYNAILPLAEWKHKKGVPTKIVKLSEIPATATDIALIRNYIVNAYNTWNPAPEYVLLVGNGNYIYTEGPNRYDDYYGNMTGNYLMEISVGRIHCATPAQCSSQVNKILNYERTPYLSDTLWYKKGTCIIREDNSSYPPVGSDTVYWNNMRYIQGLWLTGGYVHIDSFSRVFGNTSTDVMNAISNGRAFVVFRGQSVTNWYSPFDAVNPNNLNNGYKLPVVMSATCATMHLASSNYQCDRFVNAGSVSDPKGAVAVLGTTQSSSGTGLARVRGTVTTGFFRSAFNDKVYKLGDAFRRAKFILDSIGTVSPPPTDFPYNTTRYREWNLLGDPELNLWTATPRPLNVTLDTIIYWGPQTYSVTVKSGSTPIQNALVCAMMNDTMIYQYNYTNSSGVVTFAINPLTAGIMSVTVTAHNYIPYERNVSVIPGGLAYDIGVVSIVQPVGIYAAGASVTPKVKIKNYGTSQETFPVTFKIGAVFTQTLSSVTLNAGDTTMVSFPGWTAILGNYTTTAYTSLSSDQWRNNDTLTSSFSVVHQHDVGVTAILSPKDSISRGLTVTPRAIIKNFGGNAETFAVTFKIGTSYTQTVSSVNLGIGMTDTVEFPVWLSQSGNYATQCYTQLAGDNSLSNDTTNGAVVVRNEFLTQGFNDATFPPVGWTRNIISGSYNWERFTSGSNPSCSPYEGIGMIGYRCYYATSGSQARLVTPPIDLGVEPITFQVKFNMYHDNAYSGGTYGPDSVIVEYSTDSLNFIRVAGFRRYEPVNGWAEHYVTIGPLTGIVYVGFRAYSQYGTNIYVDNIRILPPPPADVGVFSIQSPLDRILVGTPTNITATLRSYGGANATFPTRAIVVDSALGMVVFSKDTTISLMVDSSQQITYGQFTPVTNKIYSIIVATNLTNDEDRSNDSMEARAKTTPGSDPDGAGYFYESTQNSSYGDTVSYNWFDISSRFELTGWTPSYDDGNVKVGLPFNFPFYGQYLCSLYVCTNGFLQFPTTFTSQSVPNRSLPYASINNFIGPLWDDLDMRTTYTPPGKAYQYNDPMNNFVIFQWDSVPRYNQSAQRNTFQVILYKDGRIKYQYKRVSAVSETSSTVGIQGGTGANNHYQQYVVNNSPSGHAPQSQTAILFNFNKDVGMVSIEAPQNSVDSGVVITPVAVISNNGPNPADINVKFEISDGYTDIQSVTIAGNSNQIVGFAPWTARYFGNFMTRCSTMLVDDDNSANNVLTSNVKVRFHDVGVYQIISPKDTQYAGNLNVLATVQNFYTRIASCSVQFIIRDTSQNIIFNQSRYVAGLLPDSSRQIGFGSFNALAGEYYTQCYTTLATDDNPINDTISDSFVVIPIAAPPGWTEKPRINTQIPGKYVKDGGALVATENSIYALRGNNSREFSKYDGTGWVTMPEIPVKIVNGKVINKRVKKGGALCYDRDHKIYAVKGGGTQEFWAYNISANQWNQKADVLPLKGLKGGTRLVYANGSVYLLAGGRKITEPNFYRYDTTSNAWAVQTNAPFNPDNKPYKDGSAITALGNKIYATKGGGKNNYFFVYDISAEAWTQLDSIPLVNFRTGKKVKVKNGGSLTNDGNFIYAIKGGGKNEFWQYSPANNNWTRKETIPLLSNNKKSVPKAGAALACLNNQIYLLKGNNTNEFWCYTPTVSENLFRTEGSVINTVMTEEIIKTNQLTNPSLLIRPNPCQSITIIRYAVPISSRISIKLYALSGVLVQDITNEFHSAGIYTRQIMLENLSAGIYFIKYQYQNTVQTKQVLIIRDK